MTPWTADQAQRFLASITDDRDYATFVLFLARGPRRGELAGLRWKDLDQDAGTVRLGLHTRVVVGGHVIESQAKTTGGRRMVPLDPGLVSVLREHRKRQLAERLAWGPGWTDSGYVFTREDGQPYHPEHISDRFETLARRAGVPMIRLHDLRHSAASLALADGTNVKVVQELLGHASPSITQQVYAHVMPGMAEDAGRRLSNVLGIGEEHRR
jgi:integrase